MEVKPPYYAVIFSSKLKEGITGYSDMANKLEELLKFESGYLGMDTARDNSIETNNQGITVSYWKDLESIKKWKKNATHLTAQKQGKENWYSDYTVRICKVEREYSLI